jgi:hypothetical protein
MNRNTEVIRTVALRLVELSQEVAFLGGAVTSLLISDPAAATPRVTDDVDLIVDVGSRVAYYNLSARLRALGFREDHSDGAPICRWLVENIKVDVMPIESSILGFGNRWYASAIQHAEPIDLDGLTARIVTAPFFLGTKLEAFDHRGDGDHRSSRDLEDFVTVIDGRAEVTEEIRHSPVELKTWLADRVGRLLDSNSFLEALPGHLPGDPASQARASIVLERLVSIAGRDSGRDASR